MNRTACRTLAVMAVVSAVAGGVAATAAEAPRPQPQLTAPAGEYRVVTIPVKEGVVWIALRDGKVSTAHVVSADRGFYDVDAAGLKLDGTRLTGQLTGPYYDDARARPGKVATFAVDCTIAGDKATGATPGTVRTPGQLAKANALAAGKDWPAWCGPTSDFRGAPSGQELVEDLNRSRLVWVSEAPIRHAIVWRPTGYGAFASPIVGSDKVFLYQLRASGADAYDHGSDAPAETIAGRTYKPIRADDEALCLDARTGALLWKVVFPDAAVNAPLKDKHLWFNHTGCYSDGKVFMMGSSWRLYCLDAATGKLVWQGDIGKAHADAEKQKQEMLAQKRMWNLRGDVPSHLAVADGVLFVHDHLGGTSGYDAATGRLLWTVSGTPTRWASGGKEYVLCRAGATLRCIEPKSGKEIWKADVGASGNGGQILLTGDYLLAESGGKAIGWKLSPAGAAKAWEKDLGYSRPAGGVHCADGESFYIRFSMKGGLRASPAPLIRLAAATGEVQAVNFGVPSGGWHGMQWYCDGRILQSQDTCHGFGYLRMFDAATLRQMSDVYISQGGSGYDVPLTYPYVDGRLFLRGMYRIYCYDLRDPASVSGKVAIRRFALADGSPAHPAKGEKVCLVWQAFNADSVAITPGGTKVSPGRGTLDIAVNATTTFTLTASGKRGHATAQLTVPVMPAVQRFTASADQTVPGGPVELAWKVVNADAAEITPGVGKVAAEGKVTVRPKADTTYKITPLAAGDVHTESVAVTTVPAAPAAKVEPPLVPGLLCTLHDAGGSRQLSEKAKVVTAIEETWPERIEWEGCPTKPDQWSCVYTGFLKVPADDVYAFELTAVRIGRLAIDGKDLFGEVQEAARTAKAPLAAGWHPIRVMLRNWRGPARLAVKWAPQGQPLEVLAGQAIGHKQQ